VERSDTIIATNTAHAVMGFAALYPSYGRTIRCAAALRRHCERSEAIHTSARGQMDCFAALAMTGIQYRDLAT
jgi:hypothetical protein